MKQPTPTFQGHIAEKGKIKIFAPEKIAMARWINTFKVGTKLELIIRKWHKKRTNEQNAYYWDVVIPILADYFGHDNPEDMHEDLKLKFNPVESKVEPGKIIGGTTTTMDTVEFFSGETSYVERICRWSSMEHGIYIPPPKKALPDKEVTK